MRRLPVYLLVDTSGSMKGEAIAAANNGLQALISTLKSDPFALESVFMSIITFDREVKEIVPLTSLEDLSSPVLQVPESGPTLLGKALEMLEEKVGNEIVKNTSEVKGDWKPLLFVITDGKPSDKALYKEMAAKAANGIFAEIVACAAGPEAQVEPLKMLTKNVFTLATMDGASFTQFFKWVSQSIQQKTALCPGSTEINLPPPPPEMTVVF